MVPLVSRTSSQWVERAVEHLDEILLDHAHAEKKAAGTAVTLLFRYPDRGALLAPLARLAREELEHFERLLGCLQARGLAFARQKPSPYAGLLQSSVRRGEPQRLLDTLLCCALIEARSCERFRLLARRLESGEPALALLYRDLGAAEARHQGAYLRLARGVLPAPQVQRRLRELAEHEAEALASCPPAPRLHA